MEEEQAESAVEEKLDQLEERLYDLEEHAATVDYSEEFRERLEDIQDQVEEWEELQDEKDDFVRDEIEKLGNLYENLAEKHNSFVSTATDSLQQQNQRISELEKSLDIPGEVSSEDSSDSSEEQVEDEEPDEETGEGSEDSDLECPQCGDYFASIQGMSTHTSRSDDHVNIIEFFKNEDGVYECIFCGQYENRDETSFQQHVSQTHGIGLTELYLENFEELAETTRVDDDGFNVNGNIPELHEVKYLEDYSIEKAGEIAADWLDSQEGARRLSTIGEEVFDQELTGASEREKLRQGLDCVDRVESRNDPFDGRKNAYFTGESKEVRRPE
ncbi:hypothetical protein SAMN05443574_12437 [Haloarcula vallismortis]|nr:hypothetical protein SAMN05443574_12437 [Haloarcula vallismortis]